MRSKQNGTQAEAKSNFKKQNDAAKSRTERPSTVHAV
jgi:hypothetical protein